MSPIVARGPGAWEAPSRLPVAPEERRAPGDCFACGREVADPIIDRATKDGPELQRKCPVCRAVDGGW